MSRNLIDRDVLLEKAKQEQRFYKDEYDAMESGYLDEEREIVKEAYSTMTDCVSLINNAPTVDAVEVVRCKECKYRPHLRDAVDEDDAEELKHGYFNGFDLRFPTEGKCPCQVLEDEFYSWIPDDDWFCADGERRDDA